MAHVNSRVQKHRDALRVAGLRPVQKPSQVMIDKAVTMKRDRVGPTFGRIDEDALVGVERCLAVFLSIAK